MTNSVLGKGIEYPIKFDTGRLERAEGVASVNAALKYLCSTRKGFRFMLPEFGCDLNRILFEPCTEETAQLGAIFIREAVETWIERIDRIQINYNLEPQNSKINFLISYWLINDATPELFVYPFYLNNEIFLSRSLDTF